MDILDLGQMQSRGFKLNFEFFSLHKVIAQAINTLKFKAAKSRVTIVPPTMNKLNKHRLNCIWGDPQRCVQVLSNLLSNAVKFSKSNSHVEVKVDTKPLEGNEMELCLSVQDHGVGISPENVERLCMREFDAYEEHRSMNN